MKSCTSSSNRIFFQVGRSFLASMILVFDLLIVMQDWEFPHFAGATASKLPGFQSDDMGFELPSIFTVHDREVLIQVRD